MATGPHAHVPVKTGPASRELHNLALPKQRAAPADKGGDIKCGPGKGPNWNTKAAAKGQAQPKKGPA